MWQLGQGFGKWVIREAEARDGSYPLAWIIEAVRFISTAEGFMSSWSAQSYPSIIFQPLLQFNLVYDLIGRKF